MNTDQSHRDGPEVEPDQDDLETRVGQLEKQVEVLAAAVDAASRMQVATPRRIDQDIRLAGGRLVRRILARLHRVEEDHQKPGAE